MILLDQEGLIRFLNEPAKFALPHLKYGMPLTAFVHEAHQGRLEACLQNKHDFSPKLVQLQFKKLSQAFVWEVFRLSSTGEVVMLTQETGFADVKRELLVQQQEEIFQALEDAFFEMNYAGIIVSMNQKLKDWLPNESAQPVHWSEWFEKSEVNQGFYDKVENLKERQLADEGLCFFPLLSVGVGMK